MLNHKQIFSTHLNGFFEFDGISEVNSFYTTGSRVLFGSATDIKQSNKYEVSIYKTDSDSLTPIETWVVDGYFDDDFGKNEMFFITGSFHPFGNSNKNNNVSEYRIEIKLVD